MFACFDPFSVSMRGRPAVGPNRSMTKAWANSSTLSAFDSVLTSDSKSGVSATVHLAVIYAS